MKTTRYRPKKAKRSRTHGFLKRSQTRNGRAVLTRRRRKGRRTIAI